MKKIMIIGATSGIAEAVIREYSSQGAHLFLVARDLNKLQAIVADAKTRGASNVGHYQLDVNNVAEHKKMLQAAVEVMGSIDVSLIAHGTLPDQAECQENVDTALYEFQTNAVSSIAILTLLGNYYEKQKSGTIAVITSVAGDRGRPTNYLYGSAKAAVSTFLEGFRVRMLRSHVGVLDVKPGFVATAMTAHLDLPVLLTAKPEKVASDIVSAVNKNKSVIYTPTFWCLIMLIIKSIPRVVFNKVWI